MKSTVSTKTFSFQKGVIDGERPLKFPPHNIEFSSWKSVRSTVLNLLSDLNVLKALPKKSKSNLIPIKPNLPWGRDRRRRILLSRRWSSCRRMNQRLVRLFFFHIISRRKLWEGVTRGCRYNTSSGIFIFFWRFLCWEYRYRQALNPKFFLVRSRS